MSSPTDASHRIYTQSVALSVAKYRSLTIGISWRLLRDEIALFRSIIN